MIDNRVNSLCLLMTDNSCIPITLPKLAHLRCGMIVYDGKKVERPLPKVMEKKLEKREIREKRNRETNLFFIICKYWTQNRTQNL